MQWRLAQAHHGKDTVHGGAGVDTIPVMQ
ncbi:MAG: hypothetical protein H6995_04450 [Pseudomonadales bacterium]|nr:hypothetical protein [Pseudomonadales bacterium]